jgi:hypothetical protein
MVKWIVEIGHDGNGDWEWEPARDESESLEAARKYRSWLERNVEAAAFRIVERTDRVVE